MANINKNSIYGKVTISPNKNVVTGSLGTWTLTIKIGKHGIDDGGHIKIAWRDVTDWNPPQFQDKTGLNYTTIETSGKAKLLFEFKEFAYIRPWRPCVTITIYDGYLAEGDTITITYGDTRYGSNGSMAQTFIEDTFEFRVLVDPFGTGQYNIINDCPTLKIVAGEPDILSVVIPSETIVGEPIWVSTRMEDEWGNTSKQYTGNIILSSDDPSISMPKAYKFTPDDEGTHRFKNIIFNKSGTFHITVTDPESNISNISNPIQVFEKQSRLKLYWGDLHGQTEETVGTGTVDQYLLYARDDAALDFVSHVGNDFQITKKHYRETQQLMKKYHVPKKFVTFLGYEWSGNTPVGGDHNVYFLKDDQKIHRSSHALISDTSDEDDDRYLISELYKTFNGRNDVIIIPHIGGRRAILDYLKTDLTPFIEVSSVHGHFEWFIRDAMERNLKVGFVAGSDDHTCRPGKAKAISRLEAVKGGLMGVFARNLTREALWEAFRKRNVYATTGERIILRFRCENAIMGDEITLDQEPILSVEVIGTCSLEKVQIVRGLDSIYDHNFASDSKEISNKIKVAWSGARVTTRRRNIDWSGEIKIKNGRIIDAEEYAFDLPWDGIKEKSENHVKWKSMTSGDEDGVILTLESNNRTSIDFNTKVTNISFKMKDLGEARIYELGEFEQKVKISRLSVEKSPSCVKFHYKDHEVNSGLNSYYIKVKQSNGEKAWSSPIFVNYQ